MGFFVLSYTLQKMYEDARQADQLGRELPKKRRRSEVSAPGENGSLMPSAGKPTRKSI
jgi:hypothetical protein